MPSIPTIRHTAAAALATALVAAQGALALILVAPAGAAASTHASAGGAPTVSPAPGSPAASPDTQISVLGVAPRSIDSVRVTGSVSGVHAGRLEAYSGGQGASFVLAHPLTQGERVAVVITIAGRATMRYSFTVATLAATPPILTVDTTQPSKLQSFVTEPGVTPPRIKINHRNPKLGGDVFLTPLPAPIVHPGGKVLLTFNPVGPGGPMIINGQGRLIWFHQLQRPDVAANLQVQKYGGKRVLTWWQGTVTVDAYGTGQGMIANSSYHVIKVVHAGNGYAMDIHEFTLTPQGDAFFTAYSPIMVHLPGSPAGVLTQLMDAIVQEVDVRTGLVVWEWHAYGHIPLADSYVSPGGDYDAYHLNSIQALPDGRLLISARDTCAIYDIDQRTGKILWTLGGKASTFKLGRGARFWFQHDAQLLPDGDVSLFDDEAGPPVEAPDSRGLILALNERSRTATVVHEYLRPGNDTSADSEGSLQALAGGDEFAGFGSTPFFSEFSAGGSLLFDGSLPVDDGSYRVYTFPWNGMPTTRPVAVVKRVSPHAVSAYVSWNGATAVARWEIVAAGSSHPLATVADRSFETRIPVSSSASRFVVRALNAAGHVLASSQPVSVTG